MESLGNWWLIVMVVFFTVHLRFERDKEGRTSFVLEKKAVGKALIERVVELLGKLWKF